MVFCMGPNFKNLYKNIDRIPKQAIENNKGKQTTPAKNVIDIFKDIVSVRKHNASYDQLLQVYTNHISQVLSLKFRYEKRLLRIL